MQIAASSQRVKKQQNNHLPTMNVDQRALVFQKNKDDLGVGKLGWQRNFVTGFEGNIISLNKILCASFVKIFEIFDDCLLVGVKMNNSNTNLYYVQFPIMMVVDFIHFFYPWISIMMQKYLIQKSNHQSEYSILKVYRKTIHAQV